MPFLLMKGTLILTIGREADIAAFGWSPQSFRLLGQFGLAAPYVVAGLIGLMTLFAVAGSPAIRWAGSGVFVAALGSAGHGFVSEAVRLTGLKPVGDLQSVLAFADQIGRANV